jgi:multidrug efflux pump subunit AcrB
MIARLIAWSARNLLLVLFGTGFAAAAGIYALVHLPLDAIPDLSDTQVIVYTEYPGQAPQVIEDQVTYPLATAMLTVPKSKVVRGFSFFGVSFVYVIFEDGTDIYWARSRVLEFLNAATSRLPAGVAPSIGPDATGVGWVYQYALMSKELNLADTRALQDWNLKFALAKAEGVAEVASVGGFVKQYNVILDPQRMRDLGITMQKMREAIRAKQRRRRWPHGRIVRVRIRDPRQGLPEEHQRSRRHPPEDRKGHAGPAAGRGAGRAWTGRKARHHRAQRRGRGRQRHHPAAFRLERSERDRKREEAVQGDRD